MKKNSKLILVLLIVLNVFFININLTLAVTDGDNNSSSSNIKIYNTGNTTTDLSYCIDYTEKTAGKANTKKIRENEDTYLKAKEKANISLNSSIAQAKSNGYTVTNVSQVECIKNSSRDESQLNDARNNIPTLISASVDDDYTVQKLRYVHETSYTCTASYDYYGTSVQTKTGVKKLTSVEYNSSSSEFAGISEKVYCLQQGRTGPNGTAMNYTALEDFDLSNCTGSSSYSYQCGLASILLNSANVSFDANGNISKSDAGYSYASVSSALRAYAAYYHKYVDGKGGIKDSDGSINSGADSAESSAFDYYSKTDVYDKSMEYYLNGGAPLSCNDACSNKGVFCYSNDTEKKNIEDFTSLLQSAVNFAIDPENSKLGDFIDQIQSNNENNGVVTIGDKVDVNYDFNKNNKSVTVELEFKEMYIGSTLVTRTSEIEVPVKYCNELDDGCNVVITVTDKYGNSVDNNAPGYCEKNYCKFTVDYSQICDQLTNTTTDNYLVIRIYGITEVEGGVGAGAFIKNYVTASGEIAQQFVGFDINGLQTSGQTPGSGGTSSGNIIKKEDLKEVTKKTTSVVCPCNTDKRCDDFEVKNNLPGYCSNYGQFNKGIYDTYDKGTIEEPYMNCIMNACEVSQRNQYDFSSEYGVNTSVCRIFCREEIEFYMANKTRVYAGMQFKYQIDNVLGSKRKLTNGHSLTSMVLQKRQCATEIYYDHVNPLYNYGNTQTWQEQYEEKLRTLMDKWREWKKYEALHKQAYWACLIPETDGHYSAGGTCASGTCPCNSSGGSTITEVKYWYSWPITRGEADGNKYKDYTIRDIDIETESGSNKIEVELNNPSIVSASYTSGSANSISSCTSTCCGEKKLNEETGLYYCTEPGSEVSGSCIQGKVGDVCEVQTKESAASKAFKAALDDITQLVYDLQNCNLYTTGELDIKYNDFTYEGYAASYSGDYNKATGVGTTKDYILSLANCEDEDNCIGLEIEYDDARYGASTIFGKEVEIVKQSDDIKKQEDTTYYCVNSETGEKSSGNSYNATCYPGPGKTDKDLNGGNQTRLHNWLACKGYQKGVECESKEAKWSINDFAIFTVVSEADFWQPKEYSTEAYTGLVSEGAGYGNSLSLDKYVFPVSMDTESGSTGAYDIRHRYTNVGSILSKTKLLNHNYYEFTCQYEVFNITNLYDCELQVDSSGNVDLSSVCNNLCYEIENGVPVIREDNACAHWSDRNTSSKGYGFIYRNVELGNLFPADRAVGNNWLENSDIKSAIEATASDMYSDGDKYLQYSFILNSDAIKKIKEYNKNKNVRGGYVDNSYDQCYVEPISGSTGGFYECTTSFMNEIRTDNNNFGVQVIKSDGIKGGDY